MFFCDCGGLLLVEAVEDYPDLLHPSDKLQYERKCKAKCAECAKVYTDLNYD